MECPVCFEPYDLERHRPKVLVPCGHSVCLACLLDPAFGKQCPQDRKPFRGKPAQLPDCMAVINWIGQGGANTRPALWCRDCSADFSDQCADDGHTPCSLKKLRTEQAASQVQVLQRGVDASTALQQHLEACNQDVEARLQACSADQRQLQEALAKLQAATEGQAGFKQAMDAAELLGPEVERLEESTSLAGLRGRCSVAVQAEDGAEWRASVALEDGKHALRHALLELRSDGDLTKVDATGVEQELEIAVEGRALDVAKTPLAEMTVDQVAEFLQRNSLTQVRSLSGVDCSPRTPQICVLLLRAFAPHLEDVELVYPQEQHMKALSTMPLLRKLSLINLKGTIAKRSWLPVSLEELHIKNAPHELMLQVKSLAHLRKLVVVSEGTDDAPELPLQLEELALECCSERQALSIQRMPRLRRLSLSDLDLISHLTFPARSPLHCGLSWLQIVCDVEAGAPLLSLLRAHADTLREIQLFHDSSDARPILSLPQRLYSKGLPGCLRESSFPKLERLVLLRRRRDSWVQPSHSAESCRLQVRELKDALRVRNAAVSVACDVCDEGVQL